MARLFAKVFQHENYAGEYRWIKGDVSDIIEKLGFNDKISSIIVYKGNHYQDGDKLRFYEHVNFGGGYLDLGPGFYRNIHLQPFSFGDKISSVDMIPPVPEHGLGVRLMVRVYEHINYKGQYRDLLLSEDKFSDIGFNDKVSSIRVYAGEDYTPGWVCDFYEHNDYSGSVMAPGRFGPGMNLPDITAAPHSFNDIISSCRIYRMR